MYGLLLSKRAAPATRPDQTQIVAPCLSKAALRTSARVAPTRPAGISLLFVGGSSGAAARRWRRKRRGTLHRTQASAARDLNVCVVGAGVAGLVCARYLAEAGAQVEILEASDGVGGRVRSDQVDGFTLDRGFHIFLDSYQESQQQLDLSSLDLHPFYPGADVHFQGAWHRVGDPFRAPWDSLRSLAPNHAVGSPLDKLRIGLLFIQAIMRSAGGPPAGDDETVLSLLQDLDLSPEVIDRFFRPFVGGIYFDPELQVSAKVFEFVLASIATGNNCLPAGGIGAVSRQLGAAARAAGCQIRLGHRVTSLLPGPELRTSSEEGQGTRRPDAVVVATDLRTAEELLGHGSFTSPEGSPVGTTCLYFSLPEAELPTQDPVLLLNGELPTGAYGSTTLANATFLSNVAPSYAPPGRALLSCTLLGVPVGADDDEIVEAVRCQLQDWFGSSASSWQYLRLYRIPLAQAPGRPPALQRSVRIDGQPGMFLCGEHREAGVSLDGTLRSGRRCAEALLADMGT